MVDVEKSRVQLSEPLWETTIDIPVGDVLSLNQRKDRRAQAATVRYLRQMARQMGVVYRMPKLRRARVVYVVSFPDRRRRDPHNLMPTMKAIVDGFIDAGFLPDDSWQHLDGPDPRSRGRVIGKKLGRPMYSFRIMVYPYEDIPVDEFEKAKQAQQTKQAKDSKEVQS